MRILFIHQNFPGQFKHLAPALAARGHEVIALGINRPSIATPGVRVVLHRPKFTPPAPGTEASAHIPATLADAVATLQPAMVLVLGHVAARAALGRTEPLGRLRAGPHQLAGCPAVVTYDPAFLLRSQDTKAAAWADLCHALALVRGAGAGSA